MMNSGDFDFAQSPVHSVLDYLLCYSVTWLLALLRETATLSSLMRSAIA